MFAGTAGPVVGANVSVYEASLTHPNPGAAITTTTTNSDGMWEFSGLSDSAKDVKVEYTSRVKWYKGLTLHSVYAVREFAEDTLADQNLVDNGGAEVNTGTAPFSPGTSFSEIIDRWQAKRGVGDTLTITHVNAPVVTNSQKAVQAVYTKSAGNAFIEIPLPTILAVALRGKTISGSAQVRQTVGNSAQVYITDGVNTFGGAFSATTGSFVTLKYENFLVDNAAAGVSVGVTLPLSTTVQIDNVMLNLGTTALIFVPKLSDSELSWTIVEAAPTADTARLSVILNNLAERVKSIIGAAGNDWKDAIPATLTSLLATKVAKAGDTMTGALGFSTDTAGVIFSGGGHLIDVNAVGTFLRANLNKFVVQNEAANTTMAQIELALTSIFNNGAASGALRIYLENATRYFTMTSTGAGGLRLVRDDSNTALDIGPGATMVLNGSTVWDDGNTTNRVTTAKIADLQVTGAKIADATITAGKIGNGQITGTQIQDGSITDTDIHPANKDGVAGANSMRTLGSGAQQAAAGNHGHTSMAKLASGTYTGDGAGTRAISGLGFTPKYVFVQKTSISNTSGILAGHDMTVFLNASSVQYSSGNSLDADGFTLQATSGFNVNTATYLWVAMG
jgi:hypothetical protein